MDPESVAFWGIALKPGQPAQLELREGESLHVSMASLGTRLKDQTGRTVVTVETAELEKSFAVCALNAGKTESTVLDITFDGEEKVTFLATGKNEVHLVGNFSFDDNAESEEESDEELIDVYSGKTVATDGSDDEEEDSNSDEGSTLMVDDPPIITDITVKDTANGDKKLNKGKKGKKDNAPENKQGNKTKSVNHVKGDTEKKSIEKKAAVKKPTPKKPADKPSEKAVEKAQSKPLNSGKRKSMGSKNDTPAKKPKAEDKKINGTETKTPEKLPSTPTAAANGSATKSKKRR
eukprot:IDg13916t1